MPRGNLLLLLLLLVVVSSPFQLTNPHRLPYAARSGGSTELHPRRVLIAPRVSSSPSASSSSASSTSSADNQPSIRLNKCFRSTHSRRAADALIASGRVTINGSPPTGAGDRVVPFVDVVEVDGKRVNFEELNVDSEGERVYVAYWKPTGVVCTTDERIKGNIITELERAGLKVDSRLFTVGRLDKDSHGLILLTNDGRVPNAVLRSEKKKDKTYVVDVDDDLTPDDLKRLREGIVITTVAQRDGQRKTPLTAATKPCKVEQLSERRFRITLNEGRNRQIRRMCEALKLRVLELKRVEFMGIEMHGLDGPGTYRFCDENEVEKLRGAIEDDKCVTQNITKD